MVGHWFLGEALIELGRNEEGVAELERAAELSDRSSRSLAYLGYGYGKGSKYEEANALLSELEGRSRHAFVPPYFRALVHCGLGQIDEAFEYLNEACDLPDTMVRDLKVDPPLEVLREDPRYDELLRRIRLA